MNSKRGLGGFMSALLVATSMVDGASAATKKKIKKPNSAGVVFNNKNGGRHGERKKKLDFSSAKSGVVGLIKAYPKTSAGLGLAGLGAIGYGGYKIYNSKWNRYYRGVFNEKNYASYYKDNCYSPCRGKKACIDCSLEKFSGYHFIFLCDFDDSEKSLLCAHAKTLFFSNCVGDILDYLISFYGDVLAVGNWDSREFENFEDIQTRFCESFLNCSQKIKEIVKFYVDFTNKYLEELADKVLEYGEKENKKMVVEENGAVKCVARNA